MREPVTDPNALRRALEQCDALRRELMREKMRAAQYRSQLAKARRTMDAAKPVQQEQRAGC